jgi:Tfp pilus assembly PilM family ATPase
MATQTAIDYGPSRIRLLEFDGSGRKVRVLAIHEVDLRVPAGEGGDEEADDLKADALAQGMKDSGISSEPSGMAYDAGHALFREFGLPFTNEEQVSKVVRFEAESHIPLDIDDVVLQHLVLRTARDKSHILVAAVTKEDLLDRFDILDEGDLDPMFVDIDVFALYQALVCTGVAEEHEVQVIINATESSTSLLFLVGGALYAVRSLRLGTEAIQDIGGADRDIETARVHEYENKLKSEIRRTLTTLTGLDPIQAVWVTGSGSRVAGVTQGAGDAFGLEAKPLDLLSYVDHKLSDEDAERLGPSVGVALGIAFRLNGQDVTKTDFRREECAYTRKFDQVKSPLIVLSFLLFLVVALGCIDAFYRVKKVKQEYQHLLTDAQGQLEELLADNEMARQVWEAQEFGPKRVQAITTRVAQEHEDAARKLGRSDLIPSLPSALHAWILFSDLVLKNEKRLGRLDLTKLDIRVAGKNPELRISGVMESASKYSLLLQMLEDEPLFNSVKLGAANPTSDGYSAFTETVVGINLEVLEARTDTT